MSRSIGRNADVIYHMLLVAALSNHIVASLLAVNQMLNVIFTGNMLKIMSGSHLGYTFHSIWHLGAM